MTTPLTRTGGTAGIAAYFEVSATGVLTISDGTNTVTLTPSTGLTTAAGATVFADLSAMATGTGKINIRDNVAAAFVLAQGANAYLTARTTDDAETLLFGRSVTFTAISITMAASPHSLVFGTAGSNQTELTSNFVLVINSSGADKDLRLPPIADLDGVPLTFFVTGGHGAVLKSSDGVTTIGTVANNKGAVVMNGSGNFGFIPGA